MFNFCQVKQRLLAADMKGLDHCVFQSDTFTYDDNDVCLIVRTMTMVMVMVICVVFQERGARCQQHGHLNRSRGPGESRGTSSPCLVAVSCAVSMAVVTLL